MPNGNAMDFDKIVETFVVAKEKFDSGQNPLEELKEISVNAIALLISECSKRHQGSLIGINRKSKDYFVFFKGSKPPTRPVRKDLYLNKNQLMTIWNERLINEDFSGNAEEVANEINMAVYTSVIAFGCIYDIFKNSSRKTPGTFFEMLIGSILSSVTGLPRGKQISLPDSRFKVPTDILLLNENGLNLIVPTKITTRERIVQVWSQQRIVENAFGPGHYISVPVFLSELQREGDTGVNEICVPGQVGQFQKYLAKIKCLYYLDVPKSYAEGDITDLISARSFGQLLIEDLDDYLASRLATTEVL
jgi:hypothetical protein